MKTPENQDLSVNQIGEVLTGCCILGVIFRVAIFTLGKYQERNMTESAIGIVSLIIPPRHCANTGAWNNMLNFVAFGPDQ